MEVLRRLANGDVVVQCGLCTGTGNFPTPDNQDEDFDEDCSVCGGKGFHIEALDPDTLVQCARCGGNGKGYEQGHFLGETCGVCGGKGYIPLTEPSNAGIWHLLHPKVIEPARALFERKNYTEALLRSIKELNSELKRYYMGHGGEELDGQALAARLLSLENPVLQIADLETESGKNRQKGLILLIQGLFIGIRNPIAHDQEIGRRYCIHILFLLSFIHNQLDYSQLRNKPDADSEST